MRPAYWARIQSSLKRLPEQRDFGEVFGHLGHQGLDPGVELLFWQVLCQLLYAGLPQALTGICAGRMGGAAGGFLGHCGGILVVDRRNGVRRRIVACQGVIHNLTAAVIRGNPGLPGGADGARNGWALQPLRRADKGLPSKRHCQSATSLR